MKTLLLDNFDSFTYNLFHYLQQLGAEVDVRRNDAISLEEVELYSHILISPGPGLPSEAGITMQLIEKFHTNKSILGVCLGHQALAEFFGGKLFNQKLPAHGIATGMIRQNTDSWLMKGLPQKFQVGLYHSWAVSEENLPSVLRITGKSSTGVIMAMEHQNLKLAGVQFHPESILSEYGLGILENWLGNGELLMVND